MKDGVSRGSKKQREINKVRQIDHPFSISIREAYMERHCTSTANNAMKT